MALVNLRGVDESTGLIVSRLRVYTSGIRGIQLGAAEYRSASVVERWSSEIGRKEGRRRSEQPMPCNSYQSVRDDWSICGISMHLFPRFARPVRPGPNTGSSALPDSSVKEKSNWRLCSIC